MCGTPRVKLMSTAAKNRQMVALEPPSLPGNFIQTASTPLEDI
jgi:hypothetical protein